MGMAASQVMLSMLTDRKNRIGYRLGSLALQRAALTRDMKNVTLEAQEAMNSKVYKISTNGGVSFSDLTYSSLMRPNSINNNVPFLLTNKDGKVVLDEKLQKYAKMFSPDGASGGDWEGHRVEILSELTGIPADKINNMSVTSDAVKAAQAKVDEIKQMRANLKEPTVEKQNYTDFLAKAGNIQINDKSIDISKAYASGEKISLGDANQAKNNLRLLLGTITNNLSKYLREEDIGYMTEAADMYMQQYGDKYIGATSEKDKSSLNNDLFGIYESKGNYSINVQTVLRYFLNFYVDASNKSTNPAYNENMFTKDEYYLFTRDRESTEWNEWFAQADQLNKDIEEAYKVLDGAIDTDSTLLVAEEERNLKFYEALFSAVVERGWVENIDVNDNQYLNNMLQNNQYFITKIQIDKDSETGKDAFSYIDKAASNVDNIFTVADPDVNNIKLSQYEYKKALINEKEVKIDEETSRLKTEQSSINNMIKSVEAVKDKNVEMNFSTQA